MQGRETDRLLKESSAEFDRRMEKSEKRMEKLDRRLDKLAIQVGGINDNIGYHAEQFFQNVFEEKLEFGRVKYDEMIPNLAYKSGIGQIEFDIALINGNSIALIEVKNRIHPNFVIALTEERVEKFRKFFPEYGNYAVYLGIAGFSQIRHWHSEAGRRGH